jgi:L-iditol 2-dehydrogenase
VDAALADVRPAGRVVLVGIPSSDRTSFRASVARRKGVTLVLCRRMRGGDLLGAIQIVEEGRVDLSSFVTARHALEDSRAAFDALVARRGLKTVIEPN